MWTGLDTILNAFRLPDLLPRTFKAAKQSVDLEARMQQQTRLLDQNEVLLKGKAYSLCLLVIGDLAWVGGRTGHHSECIQVANSHAMHPQGR